MDTTPLAANRVTVIGEFGQAIVCDVAGRRMLVPRAVMLPGSELHKPGDRGRLVVPRALAYDLGLEDLTREDG